MKTVFEKLNNVRKTRPAYGTFDDPIPPSDFTEDERYALIDAGVILDLRAPEDKDEDDPWYFKGEGE